MGDNSVGKVSACCTSIRDLGSIPSIYVKSWVGSTPLGPCSREDLSLVFPSQ